MGADYALEEENERIEEMNKEADALEIASLMILEGLSENSAIEKVQNFNYERNNPASYVDNGDGTITFLEKRLEPKMLDTPQAHAIAAKVKGKL